MTTGHELAKALRTGPFELAVQAAVRASGLSLDRLAHRLGTRGVRVSASSLSNWQTGRSRPERAESLHAVRALEEVLDLPRDALVQLLGPRRPRGRWLDHVPGSVHYDAIFDDHARLTKIVAEAEMADPRRYTWLTVEDTVRFDDTGTLRVISVRLVLSALTNAVDSCLVFYRTDDGTHPAIHPVDGCRLGRTRLADDYLVAELLLDHHLNRGDVHLLEFDQRFPQAPHPAPVDHYYKAFRAPCRTYLLRIAFDPAAVPIRMHSFQADRWGAEPTESRPLPCQRNRVTHLYAANITPGVVGVRWEWH
ncbi:transcriptional regulator with XRE-family HTH domain [Actinokineospora baliensis]|uniref:helix-turn-helix domain-containing protein n=1 Tax=Actinokineospora baliensis TaxID=547056 RepID=UPI0019580D80|nr:helix-turn-helix transcriptional regulator [Actinokineospora baliensis]MBM7770412.1 transcriptional regulator with XRE-family HTH domain [Actinokineospora baliensis]